MKKAVDLISTLIEIVLLVFMVIMVVAMFYQVVARYVFSVSAPWTEETARFLCVWLVYIGTSVCCLRGEHIRVTVVDMFLKGKGATVFNVIKNVFQICVFAVIVYYGFQTLSTVATQKSPNMRVPMDLVYSMLPISSILSIAFLVINCFTFKPEDQNEAGGDEVQIND